MQHSVQQPVLKQQMGVISPQQQQQQQPQPTAVNHPGQANTQPPPTAAQLTPPPPSPQQVSSQFTEKYYQIRTQRPDLLVKFYGQASKVTLDDGSSTKVFTGPQEISQGSNIFADARVMPHSINCTDIPAAQGGRGGYMLQVCGTVQRKGNPLQKFAQSFFLVHADQTQNHLVVSNDMITLFPADQQQQQQQQQQQPQNMNYPFAHPGYMQVPQSSAAMMAMQQQSFMAAQQVAMSQQGQQQGGPQGAVPYAGQATRMEPSALPSAGQEPSPQQNPTIPFQISGQQQGQMQAVRGYHPPQQHIPPTHPAAQMSPRPPMSAVKQSPHMPQQVQGIQQQQQQYPPNSASPHPHNQPVQHPYPIAQQPSPAAMPPYVMQQQGDKIPAPTNIYHPPQQQQQQLTQSETQTEEMGNSFHTINSSASEGQDMQGDGRGQSMSGNDQSRPPTRPTSATHQHSANKTQPSGIPMRSMKEQIPPQNPPQTQVVRIRRPSHNASMDGSTSSSPQPVPQQSNGNGVVEVSPGNHTSAPQNTRPTYGGRGYGGGGGFGASGGAPVFSLIAQNLPADITENKIKEIFSPYGQVRGLKIRPSMDKQDSSGNPEKSYAFVDFSTEEEMRGAVSNCDGMDVEGREISVAEKRPKLNPYQSKTGSYRGGGNTGYNRDSRSDRGGRSDMGARGRGRSMDYNSRGRGRGRDDRSRGRSYRSSTPTQRS